MRILIAAGARGRDRAAELQCGFAALGHPCEMVLAPERSPPPFRSVSGRLADAEHERLMSLAIRAFEPDVAVQCGFAAGTSIRLPWLAAALGVPLAVEVDPAEVLCHRGDLRHRGREACAVTDDPARCAACCRAAAPGGLSRAAAAVAFCTRWLGDLGPFPSALHFANRRDLLVGALADAAAILVPGEAARERIVALGLLPRAIHCVAGRPAAELHQVLGDLLR